MKIGEVVKRCDKNKYLACSHMGVVTFLNITQSAAFHNLEVLVELQQSFSLVF